MDLLHVLVNCPSVSCHSFKVENEDVNLDLADIATLPAII